MSSPTPTKTQDEAILVVDKFGTKLEGDPKFCLVDKMEERICMKKLIWN